MVYFVDCPALRAIKIGVTAATPGRRLRQIQQGMPAKCFLIAATPGGAALERALHARFAAHCIRGEWFRYTPTLWWFAAMATRGVALENALRFTADAGDFVADGDHYDLDDDATSLDVLTRVLRGERRR